MQKNPFWKFIIPAIGLIIVCMLVLSFIIPALVRQYVEQETLISAQNRAKQLKILRAYYTQNVITKILGDGHLRPAINHKGIPDRVPLPATMIHELSTLMKNSGLKIKLYSEFPFPNRASRQLDTFGQMAWKRLNDEPATLYSQTDVIDGVSIVRVGIADLMVEDSCVNCHNTHPDSPKTDWKLGDERGVLEVNVPIDFSIMWAQQLSIKLLSIIAATFILICIVLYFIYNSTILRRLTTLLKKLSDQKFAMDQHAIITTTDVTGTITYVNDKFCEISGYSRKELMGQNHRLLNSANQAKSYWKAIYKTVSHGEVWHDEVRNKTKDGAYYWVDNHYSFYE